MSRALTTVSTADLLALRKLVATGAWSPPWSKAAAAAGFALAGEALAGFDDVDAVGLVAVVDAVVGERGEARRPAEIVWTGPEPYGAKARDTAVVVEQMFAEARREVFVASYSFRSPASAPPIFAPLHRVMVEHGVTARVVYDLAQFAEWDGCSLQQATSAARFFARCWPYGDPKPTLYYDPRRVLHEQPTKGGFSLKKGDGSAFAAQGGVPAPKPGDGHGKPYVSMHAKLVIADHRFVLVGSANLTDYGVAHNIELGIKVDDAQLATRLGDYWSAAIASEIVVPAT